MADCSKCDGHCCKYITIQIDKPKENIDFEELKWFLCHENISVYIDNENDWCVEVKTPCKLQDTKTNLCTNYEKRPKVCSDHESHDCEGNDDYDPHYKRIFHTMEEIDEYRKELQSGNKAQEVQSKGNVESEESE